MSYIGRGIDQIDNISTLDNLSFNGSDATFNLTQNSVAFVPVSADALQIQIDGVIQSGNYTVSGSTVTFDFTPSGSSVCNGIRHFGVGLLTTVSDGAVTEAKIGSGAVTSSKIASGVIPSTRPNVNPIIINGDMQVAQRGTSVTGQNTAGYKTVDRMYANIDSAGSYTVIQESLTSGNAYDNGFRKAFRLDCTTADASLAADDNLILFYFLEGQDLQMIKKGTSNAEKLTLSFWVKSNKTGTAQVNLVDNDNSRICGATYTISSADTWEQKVVNYAADTTGAFDNDNNKSLSIEWFLDSGSTYSGGAVPTAWEATSNSDRDQGNLDIAGSTDNDFAITGIQLEVGEYTSSTLPPFQHESFADNLFRCHRYYITQGTVGSIQDGYAGRSYSTSALVWAVPLPKPLRASPTVTLTGTLRAFGSSNTHDSTSALGVYSYANTNSNLIALNSTGFSGLTNDRIYNVMPISDCKIEFNAEL